MNAILLSQTIARSLTAARVLSIGLLLGAWASPNNAAQSSSEFAVTVTLQKAATANTGLCSSNTGVGAFGATVTVVCATGVVVGLEATGKGMPWLPVHGGAYRFLTRVSSEGQSGTVDSYTGVGTSTTFRVVSWAGQEYTEMTIGW